MYCLLCSCTNPILGKTFAPEIWTEIFSTNQIAGFFYQTYLQNKLMKKLDLLHIDTTSHKLKVSQKICWWIWSKMGMASLVMRL